MKPDPTLAAADLAIVAGHLREIRAALPLLNATRQTAALDRHALDAAIAAVVALAVDCDAATSPQAYWYHADAAASAARLYAQARDAEIDDQIGRKGGAR